MSVTDLNIAYVGGGSRDWARKLMMDLALCPDLSGHVALYDLNVEAARLNERLGTWLQDQPGVVSKWTYSTEVSLESALTGADFVMLSIQPGTLPNDGRRDRHCRDARYVLPGGGYHRRTRLGARTTLGHHLRGLRPCH